MHSIMRWTARICSTRRPKCGTCGWAERVLMVAYTLRRCGDAETIRLISARTASRRERVGYQTLINEGLAEHIRKDVA
jgi:uncharacterized DUF497 family protein